METILATITSILVLLNTAQLIVAAWKKLKPEVKKMDAEVDSEIVEAAERNLEGAKISNQMLVDRINELRAELEREREERKVAIAAEKEARRRKVEYLERRLRDAEREARDYRQWAARLAKQVVEAGRTPVAFIPTPSEESETGISAIIEEKDEK